MHRRKQCRQLLLTASLVATGISIAPQRGWGQTASSWLTGTSGTWTDAALWSTNPNFPSNGTPTGATYDAIVSAPGNYTITLASDVTISHLTFNAAGATLDQTGGTLSIAGGATLGLGTYLLSAGTFNNIGSSSLSGAIVSISNSAISNLAGATLSIGGASGTTLSISGASAIRNSGRLNWSSTGSFSTTILNSATISITLNELRLNNATVQLANGGRFIGNTLAIADGTGLSVDAAGTGTVTHLNLTGGRLAGPGTLSVPTGGVFNFDAGTIAADAHIVLAPSLKSGSDVVGTRTLAGSIDSGGFFSFSAGTTTIDGGRFTIMPTGTLSLWSPTNFVVESAPASGDPLVNNGALRIRADHGPVTLSVNSSGSGSLTVEPNSTLRLSSRLGATSVTNSGTIDMLDGGALLIDYAGGGASPYSSIAAQVVSGRNGGAWNGPGINSSVAAASGGRRGVGFGEASDIFGSFPTTYLGQTIDNSTLLIRLTYLADANLDGQVDVSDLGRLATNWQQSGTWTAGDFNYDGFVDVADLGLLATNWQSGVTGPSTSFDEAVSTLGLSFSAVPEPALLVPALAIAVLRRRRVWS